MAKLKRIHGSILYGNFGPQCIVVDGCKIPAERFFHFLLQQLGVRLSHKPENISVTIREIKRMKTAAVSEKAGASNG